jgi:hypothetical protein
VRGDVSKAARRDEGAARNVLPVCCEAPRHGGWSTGPKTAEGIEHPAGCNGKHGRRTKAAEVERAEFQRLVREAWEMLKRLRGLLSLSACQVRRSACQSHFKMQFLLQAAPKFQLLRPRPRRRDRPDGALGPWVSAAASRQIQRALHHLAQRHPECGRFGEFNGSGVAHTNGSKDGGKGSGAQTAVRVEHRAVCLFEFFPGSFRIAIVSVLRWKWAVITESECPG